MNILKNKVILITGGQGFLAFEFSKFLLKNNATVITIDIKKNKNFINLKKKFKNNYFYFESNICNENELIFLTKILKKKFKKIDVLINNAANNPTVEKKNKSKSGLKSFNLSKWNSDINVGLTGTFLATKHFSKLMLINKKGGSIINISSDLGIISPDQRIYSKNFEKPVSYSVVKSGILGFTKYCATYWKGKIRSNAICFGGVDNNLPNEFKKKLKIRIPLGRLAKKNEYNNLIAFLCSDGSSYINGATLVADGGRTIW